MYLFAKLNKFRKQIEREINRRIGNGFNFYKNVEEYYATEILKQ
jgi:hypothetical protein